MQITVTLAPDEDAYVLAEVARLQAAEPKLDALAYVQRRVSKLFQTELERMRVDRRTLNVALIEQTVDELAVAVDANDKLQALGLEMVDGRLRKAVAVDAVIDVKVSR